MHTAHGSIVYKAQHAFPGVRGRKTLEPPQNSSQLGWGFVQLAIWGALLLCFVLEKRSEAADGSVLVFVIRICISIARKGIWLLWVTASLLYMPRFFLRLCRGLLEAPAGTLVLSRLISHFKLQLSQTDREELCKPSLHTCFVPFFLGREGPTHSFFLLRYFGDIYYQQTFLEQAKRENVTFRFNSLASKCKTA